MTIMTMRHHTVLYRTVLWVGLFGLSTVFLACTTEESDEATMEQSSTDGTDGTDGTSGVDGTPGADGTDGTGAIEVIEQPTGPVIEAGEELPVTVSRGFECQAANAGERMVVAQVLGGDGATVQITPTDPASCQYALVYHEADGTPHTLSEAGSGYLFVAARKDGDITVVCASDIRHSADPARGSTGRRTDAVPIQCAARQGGSWSALVDVVTPTDAAAWIRGISADPETPGRYLVRYARDFSFNVLNMSDNGRPADDGIYEQAFDVGSAGVVVGTGTKVEDVSNPLAGGTFEKWEPSADDKAAMSDFIDFSDGPCPNGCPIE